MAERYEVRDVWGNVVGWLVPRDADFATTIVTMIIGVIIATVVVSIFLIFKIIQLCFRYPKVMLPIIVVLLAVVGIEYYLNPQFFQPARPQQTFAQITKLGPDATAAAPAVSTLPGATAAAPATAGIVAADRLNVRAGPGASEKIVGKLAKNAQVAIHEADSSGKWVRVTAGALTGWVAKEFITVAPPAASEQGNTAGSSSATGQVPMPDTGMWIMSVEPGSVAAQAGMHSGQLLVKIGDQAAQSAKSVNAIIAGHVGSPITALLWENGQQVSLTITPKEKVIGLTLCQLSRCPQGKSP